MRMLRSTVASWIALLLCVSVHGVDGKSSRPLVTNRRTRSVPGGGGAIVDSCGRRAERCDPILRNSANARARQPIASTVYETYSCVTSNVIGYEVHVISVYEPWAGQRDMFSSPTVIGDIQVNITEFQGTESVPVRLVLSSYEAVEWHINAPDTVVLDEIYLLSYYLQHSSVQVHGTAAPQLIRRERRYFGYGRRSNRLSELFTFVQGHFGFLTSFTGTYVTDSWSLTVGVAGRCVNDSDAQPNVEDFCQTRRSGHYQHPRECNMFIQCAHQRTYQMSCAPGTLWNDVIKTCDHPHNVNCGHVTTLPTELPADEVTHCLESDFCWLQYNFTYDDNWTACHGAQYVSKTSYGYLVGVVLCTETRYKLYMAEELTDIFRNIADSSGHGQDHCEFVGGSEGHSRLPNDFWQSPIAMGYWRSEWGEPLQLGRIGFGTSDVSDWTGKYYVTWYECGLSIPGQLRVLDPNDVTTVATTPPTTPVVPSFDGTLRFLSTPNNVTATVGVTETLSCSVNHPEARIYWYKDNQQIDDDPPEGIQVEGGRVVFEPLTPSHSGEYICEVETEEEYIVAFSYVEVEVPSCGINFVHRPSNAVAQAGDRHVLRCSAQNGRLTEWFKRISNSTRKVRIPRSRNYRVYLNGDFRIQSVCLKDAAEYTCVVHKRGATCSDEVTVRLDVQYNCGETQFSQPGQRFSSEQQGKIVGGSNADKGSAPWMVMLYDREKHSFCGGSLISDKWVLTAAHCFTEFQSQYRIVLTPERLQLKMGKYDSAVIEDQEVVIRAERFIMHPDFNVGNFDNDIALIELEMPVNFTNYISPICLASKPFNDRYFLPGTTGVVTGWGAKSEHDQWRMRHLQEIELPLVDRAVCRAAMNYSITSNMICAGHRERMGDACSGDSGGPYILKKDHRWYQAGVVSWGQGCSRPGRYGVYTKVANYFSWIMQYVQHCGA